MVSRAKVIEGKYWRQLYTAALFEANSTIASARIAEAEWALTLRARELFHSAGDHMEETSDMEDALYALKALRSVPRYANSCARSASKAA